MLLLRYQGTNTDANSPFSSGIERSYCHLDGKLVYNLLIWRKILGQYLNLVGQIRPGPPWKMPSYTPMGVTKDAMTHPIQTL